MFDKNSGFLKKNRNNFKKWKDSSLNDG